LKERGIALAVCSKNEMAVAEAAFRDHPEMVLRRADIAAFVVNWNDKAENLRSIAEQLNIGLDAIVFVDDNPVERARVRESLPMVAVPELPPDPALYVRCLADAGCFEAVSFTEDDRLRSAQYAANAEREALRCESQGMEDFLRGLEMSVRDGPILPVDVARATQLINKTNQFNSTTRRYAEDELSQLAASTECLTLQFRLTDRFGDNGLVSVMILRPAANQSETLVIESWVMSCRVFGRQLECEAMNILVEAARDRGVKRLLAEYFPTERNKVITGLYERLGFSELAEGLVEGEAKRWLLNTSSYTPTHTFINRRP
jgi:FkbH-like protein